MVDPNTDDINFITLQVTYDQLLARRLEVLTKPRPNYEIDGQIVNWADYLEVLTAQINGIKQELIQAQPFEEAETWYVE